MLQSIRNAFLPLMASTILLAACSSSKNAVGVKRDDVKGTWILNNITTEGVASSERVKLTVLDEGTADCLTGSTWTLPMNGNGSYTIPTRTGCVSGQKNIVWSYRTENDQPIFQFKKMEGGVKAKDITEGYRFKILQADASSMVLMSEISYQGRPVYVKYNFSKS
jgi:hypothetical protein